MPDKETLDRVKQDKKEGKSPSTQAGEFVREEIEHVRQGKHGVANTKQAIAIGLSKARRAGVKLPPPAKRTTSEATRRKAAEDSDKNHSHSRPAPTRSRAASKALKSEPKTSASHEALSRHAKMVAAKRKKSSE